MLEGLTFENGNLVKVHGMRPEYMDGYALIALVRLLGAEVHRLRLERERVEDAIKLLDVFNEGVNNDDPRKPDDMSSQDFGEHMLRKALRPTKKED
jgi:hypothetical protein